MKKKENASSAEYSPMMQHYLSVKEEYPETILFYRLGDFFEMFFDDARTVASELDLVLTWKAAGKEKVVMCGVPARSVSDYARRLVDKGYKVALCEQVSDPKARGLVEREVVQVLTPGTFLDDTERADSRFLGILVPQGIRALFVRAELATGNVEYDWIDLSELSVEQTVLENEISELLVSKSFPSRLKKSLSRITMVTEMKVPVSDQPAEELAEKMLHDYIEETRFQKLDYFKPWQPVRNPFSLVLDYDTRKHLELTSVTSQSSKALSLWKLLDHTRSAMGSRLLKRWIERPLRDTERIIQRQDAIEALMENYLLLEELQEILREIWDLERSIGKIQTGTLPPSGAVRIKTSLLSSARLLEKWDTLRGKKEPFDTDPVYDLWKRLDAVIDETDPQYWIRPGYSQDYDRTLELSTRGEDSILKLEAEEQKRVNLPLKIIEHRTYGYLIEIRNSQLKDENHPVLLKDRYGYFPKQSLTGSTRFQYEPLQKLEEDILSARDRREELEKEIFSQVLGILKESQGLIDDLAAAVAEIDVLCALARDAMDFSYVRPVFNTDHEIDVRAGRHPMIETRLDRYVPNDWVMSRDELIECITGPNMGGKSTYLRQNALIAVMAQMGSFVPASYCSLPVFDRIFTRIGANDDLSMGYSTFLVEMMETNRALQFAGENSLILLDEIGRGTSTFDGMALAQAIIEYIESSIKAKTLFSTHYRELTRLEEELEGFHNVHAEVLEKKDGISFAYRITPGIAESSYGIQVAKLASLPEWIIKRAGLRLRELERESPDDGGALFFMDTDSRGDRILSLLERVQPDDISPREAHRILCQLKEEAAADD